MAARKSKCRTQLFQHSPLKFTCLLNAVLSLISIATAYVIRCSGLTHNTEPDIPRPWFEAVKNFLWDETQVENDLRLSALITNICLWYFNQMEKVFHILDIFFDYVKHYVVGLLCVLQSLLCTIYNHLSKQSFAILSAIQNTLTGVVNHLKIWLDSLSSSFSLGEKDNTSQILCVIIILTVTIATVLLCWKCLRPRPRNKAMDQTDVITVQECPPLRKRKAVWVYAAVILYRCVLLLVPLSLLLSLPWEFMRLYQLEVAKNAAVTLQGMPADCLPDKMSLWQSIRAWGVWLFSWNSSPCEQYHQALLVDPLWHVTPVMVLSSAVSRCLLRPLELLSSSISTCLTLLLRDVPLQWQPVVMVTMITLCLLLAVMLCKYRVAMPLMSIEPYGLKNRSGGRSTKKKITNSNGGSQKRRDIMGGSNHTSRQKGWDVQSSCSSTYVENKRGQTVKDYARPAIHLTHRGQGDGRCTYHDNESSHDDSCISDKTYDPDKTSSFERSYSYSFDNSGSLDRSYSPDYSFDSRESSVGLSLL